MNQTENIARMIEALIAVQRFLETCEPGDYSSSFVCHPSFDEEMYQVVCDQVDAAIEASPMCDNRKETT